MSVYFNQTNITPGTSVYITRAEVADAFSTIAGDLSGVNISSLFYNPNPNFSSIVMNKTGSIGGGASVSAEGALGLSTLQFAYSQPNLLYNFVPSLKDPLTGVYGVMATGANVIKQSQTAGQYHTQILPTQYNYVNTLGSLYPLMTLNTASMGVALSNVSSINGVNPTTAGTTFTNLTGSNLTTTGTLTSPQIVSVSSINGVIYSTALTNVWAGGGSTVVPSGTPTLVASISLPAGYLRPGTNYLVDVPVQVGALPPSPTGFVLFIGLRCGTNGTTNYQLPLYITSGSGVVPLQITAVAQTNASSVASQTIDIVVLQQSGSTWTAPITAPTTGLNTYTIKPLT